MNFIACTDGRVRDFMMSECVLSKLEVNAGLVEFISESGKFHCWDIVTNGGNVVNVFCERIGSMLNQTCPADITSRTMKFLQPPEEGYDPALWLIALAVVSITFGMLVNEMRKDQERLYNDGSCNA